MNQSTDSQYGSLAGTVAGAAIGGLFQAPLLGASLGSAAGGVIGGLFGGSSGPSYDQSWFDTRNAQIANFGASLSAARSGYVASLGNMYNDAYSRFAANAEPQFAANGLGTNSGAFAQALAYKSAEYQAQLDPTVYQAQRDDAIALNNAQGQEWQTEINARTGGANKGYDTANNNAAGVGQGLFGALSGYVNKSPGYTPRMLSMVNTTPPSMWGAGGGTYGNSPSLMTYTPSNKLGLSGGY